ncbi:membrane hypothetical protein [Clostridium neonatale]|nr:membrane hypothetical protein [Clostridium neonatale]
MVLIISLLYINNKLTVPILFIITFINSSLESFRAPASVSIKPYILKKQNLDLGMSFNSSCLQLSQLIGIASAPLIISIIGISGSLIIDSITFFLCSCFIITLKYSDTSLKNEKITLKNSFFDFKMGFKFVMKNKFILNLCIFCAIINALFVPIDSLSVVFVSDLNLGPEGISIMQIPLLIAMFLGGLIYPMINKKIKSKTIFILSGSILGVIYFLISLLSNSASIILKFELGILCFFLGFLLNLVNLPISISAVTQIEEEYLSKVSGIINAFALATVPITSFIVGIIIEYISTRMLFGLFGIITSIIFLLQIFNKYLDKLNY